MIERNLRMKVMVSLDAVDDCSREVSSYRFWSDDEKSGCYVEKDGTLDCRSLGQSVDIHFEIANNVKGREFVLAGSGEDAIWVGEGARCPTDAGLACGKVAISRKEEADHRLVIHNWNEYEEDLAYLLRFRDAASSAIYQLDPVIKNGGGGKRRG